MIIVYIQYALFDLSEIISSGWTLNSTGSKDKLLQYGHVFNINHKYMQHVLFLHTVHAVHTGQTVHSTVHVNTVDVQ